MRKIFFLPVLICLIAVPLFIYAQRFTDVPTTKLPKGDLIPTLVQVLNVFLGLVGIVAVVFLVWGGIQYITSAGEESKIEHAKKTITYAIIGLLVIGLAAVIVNFVVRAFVGGGGGGGGQTPAATSPVPAGEQGNIMRPEEDLIPPEPQD